MDEFKKDKWEASYGRKENFIFFPKEGVVKFLNRFVRKKEGVNTYRDILPLSKHPKALDVGCGIGRQTILMQEFGFTAIGVDISETALTQARILAQSMGHTMDNQFIRLEKTQLPFENNYFDIAISDSVFDSMNFEFARAYMQELNRTVKGLVYLNLIASDDAPTDVVVDGKHEQGTIQSYYDIQRIQALISGTQFEIKSLELHTIDNQTDGYSIARFHVVLQKQ